MTELARAKINLYLDVTAKREDGYHEIESVMQSVSLADTVSLERTDDLTVICDHPAVPGGRENLAYRAAEEFFRVTGIAGGAGIRIEKHIPVAAGLAGGSTDAAAVLRGLNRLYGTGLTDTELCGIGKTLGADVPFCVVGGTALTRGIGEKLTTLPTLSGCFFVIAKGESGISTAAAYAELDKKYGNFRAVPDAGEHSGGLCETGGDERGTAGDGTFTERHHGNSGRTGRHGNSSLSAMKAALNTEDNATVFRNMFNIFEEVVPPECGEVFAIRRALTEHGAGNAMMSGSGPSVFGAFADRECAECAAAFLRESGKFAEVCVPATR